MMSMFGSSLRENSASVSTRWYSGLNPAPRNSRRINSASVGLSSTSRTRSDFECLSINFWRLIQEQPVKSQFSHGGCESLKVHRLDNVTVYSQLVTLHHVLLFFGRGED